MKVELRLAQLLCSRLCHDLVGPAGAVNVGVEMLREGVDDQIDALGLVGRSAQQVNAKLAFYRVAFGMGGIREADGLGLQARQLIDGLLDGGDVTLDWPEGNDGGLSPPACKLLLNMVLIAATTLVRGGLLGVHATPMEGGLGLAVIARGERIRLREEIGAALQSIDEDTDSLSPHTVQAAWARLLAESLDGELEVTDTGSGEVRVAAWLPAAAAVE